MHVREFLHNCWNAYILGQMIIASKLLFNADLNIAFYLNNKAFPQPYFITKSVYLVPICLPSYICYIFFIPEAKIIMYIFTYGFCTHIMIMKNTISFTNSYFFFRICNFGLITEDLMHCKRY